MNKWLEKTYSSKRSLDKERQFKKVLLSPVSDTRGRDIYHNMREVAEGDMILHLDQTEDQIIGYSTAVTKYQTVIIEGQEYYQIPLSNFIPYIPAINIREFFNDSKHYDQLLKVMHNHEVFYRKYNETFVLRQGAYLTKITAELDNILTRYIQRSKNTNSEIVREVPIELLTMSQDISIIIGKNGSGKSQLLTSLAYDYINKRATTIAVSSSIYDKFSNIKNMQKNKKFDNYHFLGARKGPNITAKVLEIFLDLDEGQVLEQNKKNILNDLLKYIQYDAKIGIRFSENTVYRGRNLTILKDEASNKFLFESLEKFNHLTEYHDRIFWIDISEFCNIDQNVTMYQKIQEIIFLCDQLSTIGYRTSREFYLSRRNIDFPLFQASSGELTILTTMLHIASYIDQNSVILIDEPENSLHLEWQKNFVNTLEDLFYHYQPKVIIATHSPLLISATQFSRLKTNVYIAREDAFELQESTPHNQESILLDLFQIITPENRSFSELLVSLLNDLAEEKITYEKFSEKIMFYKLAVYDQRQESMLNDVLKVGNEIIQS